MVIIRMKHFSMVFRLVEISIEKIDYHIKLGSIINIAKFNSY